MSNPQSGEPKPKGAGQAGGGRRLRADAQRSADALIAAAREVFAASGVDATTREIADRAGVGMGTLFRRFPRRADLVGAVFQNEMDRCAEVAATLATEHLPFDALARWTQIYVQLIATKRGLAKAMSSDDPVYVGMAARFDQYLRPAFQTLYNGAVASGDVRADLDPAELFSAVSALCMSPHEKPDHASRMVGILIDGTRLR